MASLNNGFASHSGGIVGDGPPAASKMSARAVLESGLMLLVYI